MGELVCVYVCVSGPTSSVVPGGGFIPVAAC